MPKICMLVSEDHTRHPIIRRQVGVLLKSAYSLTVLDQLSAANVQYPTGYKRVIIRPLRLGFIGKGVWRLLRRLPIVDLGEAWWTVIWALQMIMTAVRYAKLAFDEKADVYQAHDLDTLLGAIAAGRLRQRPVVYDAHELMSEQGNPSSLRNRFLRLLEKILVPRVDYLIVPNASRAKVYTDRYSPKNPPVVILNCPPTITVERSNKLRARLGLGDSTQVALYHGTLMAGRGLEELLLSAPNFDEGIVLVVIGEQNKFYHTVLQPLWERERLAERVIFVPHIPPDEIMEYVASVDLGIVIYKNTNLNNYLCAPTKLYEYFMAQIPVAVCDFPEMRTLLEEYAVGSHFCPDDPKSIAKVVNAFFGTQPGERLRLTQELQRARERFNWELEGKKLLNIFALLTGVPEATLMY